MGEFSAGWLRLREPVDRRSRNATVAAALRDHFAGRPRVDVVDIGCGTGANLRATAALLGTRQDWCLIDHDPALLDCARDTLATWADTAERDADALVLTHAGRTITVRFRQVDLARDVDGALGDAPDLVTASAFFDLVSAPFIDALVQATVRRHAVFHTVLTVSGVHQWSPETEWDGATSRAFNAHQESDKGFGGAAGPHATALLATGFEAAGYRVATGDSPWTLGPADDALLQELNIGIAGAVAETGPGGMTLSAQWSTVRRTGAVVGHTDLVAIPPQ
ncbi:MAG: class I SAM-dependent methyltransferase [Gemmatimonadaceae bacterium]|nr:class I SAM-dependent methyltransferase [Acetobacteraceae bacterium]